jgi:flagellar hook assembly protein FlgD
LLQNYPNPFNPETWIPYQLHEASEVVIRIHNVTGELVREIKLGYKPAGLYVSQDRAVHWDGKDKFDMPVASGVYFYSIQAGSFSAVKKLIVLK